VIAGDRIRAGHQRIATSRPVCCDRVSGWLGAETGAANAAGKIAIFF
jgi:hypothetical protein